MNYNLEKLKNTVLLHKLHPIIAMKSALRRFLELNKTNDNVELLLNFNGYFADTFDLPEITELTSEDVIMLNHYLFTKEYYDLLGGSSPNSEVSDAANKPIITNSPKHYASTTVFNENKLPLYTMPIALCNLLSDMSTRSSEPEHTTILIAEAEKMPLLAYILLSLKYKVTLLSNNDTTLAYYHIIFHSYKNCNILLKSIYKSIKDADSYDYIIAMPDCQATLNEDDVMHNYKPDSETASIENLTYLLNKRGRLISVLPEHVFNHKNYKDWREYILNSYNVEYIDLLPYGDLRPIYDGQPHILTIKNFRATGTDISILIKHNDTYEQAETSHITDEKIRNFDLWNINMMFSDIMIKLQQYFSTPIYKIHLSEVATCLESDLNCDSLVSGVGQFAVVQLGDVVNGQILYSDLLRLNTSKVDAKSDNKNKDSDEVSSEQNNNDMISIVDTIPEHIAKNIALHLKDGDILVSRMGASVKEAMNEDSLTLANKVAVFRVNDAIKALNSADNPLKYAVASKDFVVIRPNDINLSNALCLFLNSDKGRLLLKSALVYTKTPYLNVNNLLELEIPYPSVEKLAKYNATFARKYEVYKGMLADLERVWNMEQADLINDILNDKG